MNRHIITCLLLLSLVLAACTPVGISGAVTDGEAGKPLADVQVELYACGAAGCKRQVSTQRTNSNGRYAFPDAAPGQYLLSILWDNPPDCPGIHLFNTLGVNGKFLVTRAGYLRDGAGGLGQRRMFAVHEFELQQGKGIKLDLTFACS